MAVEQPYSFTIAFLCHEALAKSHQKHLPGWQQLVSKRVHKTVRHDIKARLQCTKGYVIPSPPFPMSTPKLDSLKPFEQKTIGIDHWFLYRAGSQGILLVYSAVEGVDFPFLSLESEVSEAPHAACSSA